MQVTLNSVSGNAAYNAVLKIAPERGGGRASDCVFVYRCSVLNSASSEFCMYWLASCQH